MKVPVNIIEGVFHWSRIVSVPACGNLPGKPQHCLKREAADFLRSARGLGSLDKAVAEREGGFLRETAFDGCPCDQCNEGNEQILFLAQLVVGQDAGAASGEGERIIGQMLNIAAADDGEHPLFLLVSVMKISVFSSFKERMFGERGDGAG